VFEGGVIPPGKGAFDPIFGEALVYTVKLPRASGVTVRAARG
jgi:hypothetical protein